VASKEEVHNIYSIFYSPASDYLSSVESFPKTGGVLSEQRTGVRKEDDEMPRISRRPGTISSEYLTAKINKACVKERKEAQAKRRIREAEILKTRAKRASEWEMREAQEAEDSGELDDSHHALPNLASVTIPEHAFPCSATEVEYRTTRGKEKNVSEGATLNYIASSSALTLDVQMGHTPPTPGLLDSGALKGFTSLEMARIAVAQVKGAQRGSSEFTWAQLANKQREPVLGSVEVPLTIGNRTYPYKLNVLRTLAYPIIIGLDFIEEHDVSISEGAKRICIGKGNDINCVKRSSSGATAAATTVDAVLEAPKKIERIEPKSTFYEVRAARKVTLAANAIGPVRCYSNAPSNVSGVIHPHPNNAFTCGQFFLDAIHNDSRYYIPVANLDAYLELQIPKGKVIGYLESVNSNEFDVLVPDDRIPKMDEVVEEATIELEAITSYGMISPDAPVQFTSGVIAAMMTEVEQRRTEEEKANAKTGWTDEELIKAREEIKVGGTNDFKAKFEEIAAKYPVLWGPNSANRKAKAAPASIQVTGEPEASK
jgi:hypothetical protein